MDSLLHLRSPLLPVSFYQKNRDTNALPQYTARNADADVRGNVLRYAERERVCMTSEMREML